MKNILNIDNGIPTLLSNVDDGTNTLYINDELVPSSEWTGTGYYTFTSGGLTFTIQKIRDTSGNIMLQLIEQSGGTSYRLIKAISIDGKYYSIDDPAETDLADGDYLPFYDTSAGAKKKSLWSNIKEKLKNFFLPFFKTTTLDVDNITEDGLWEVYGAITGAPTTNHGLLLNMSSVGTPLQMFFPDASLYSYKRYYTGGAWTSWSLLRAGLADSATNADNAGKARTIAEVAIVGSDAENSNGWYKVCSGTLTGYNNVSLIFAVHNASLGYSGLLVVDLRCDNGSSIGIKKFGWLVRNDYALTDFIINTNGNNWTIYQNITRVRYWRDFWVLLEQSGTSITPIYPLYTLHSNVAKESTTPTATATSTDMGTVNAANKLSGFSAQSTGMGWGVQTGTVITCFSTPAGGGLGFRDNCPNSGQTSMIIDGRVYQDEGRYMCLDTANYSSYALPLAGGSMTGASGIQYPIASGNNKSGNWISAGGGYGTGSGKSGVKVISCEQADVLAGLGQDCGGGPYELSIVTGAQPSNNQIAYIRFLKHVQTSTTYTKLGVIDGSGNYTAYGNIYAKGGTIDAESSSNTVFNIASTQAKGALSIHNKGVPTIIVPQATSRINLTLPATGGTIALTSSSRRIKKNIRAITEEEAQKLLDVEVIKFDYKDNWGGGKKDVAGFIAEDVQKIIPETVQTRKDYDPNLPVDEEYNFPPEMDYQRFVPYLVKMVQMQQKEIDDLKNKIKALMEG